MGMIQPRTRLAPRSAPMRTLARPIGLGLAARGDPEEVMDWSRRARDAGLDSVWIHDSYFERDAVSFGTAIATGLGADGREPAVEGEAGFRVALGAVNPFTRHPVVLAMTGSALDELLPGRIVMGLGTGLPLRLKQMGIAFDPRAAVTRVAATIEQLRTLWSGERLPSGQRTATWRGPQSPLLRCGASSSGSGPRLRRLGAIPNRSSRLATS